MYSLLLVLDFLYEDIKSKSNPIYLLTTEIRNNLDTIECVIEEGKSSCKVKKNYNYIKELIKQKSTINEMKFLLPSQPLMIEQVIEKEYCQVWYGFKVEPATIALFYLVFVFDWCDENPVENSILN